MLTCGYDDPEKAIEFFLSGRVSSAACSSHLKTSPLKHTAWRGKCGFYRPRKLASVAEVR